MDTVKCSNCGRVRSKRFAKFCEACGTSFSKELPAPEQTKKQNNSSQNTNESSAKEFHAEMKSSSDISAKAKKFISMAAYDLAIEELEKELETNRSVPVLHALSMCYLMKCGGIKDSFDFSNWLTIVMGVMSAVDKAIKISVAEKYISEAIHMEPENNLLYKTLALCKFVDGSYEEALSMGKAITQEATSPRERSAGHIFVGNCFLNLGNPRAYENRLQYAAWLVNDDSLGEKIDSMVKAKQMVLGGAAIAGYALGGAVGGALAAGIVSAIQGASDDRQFEDNDPEILDFIRKRDAAIRRRKDEEERIRDAEEYKRNVGCLMIILVIFTLAIVRSFLPM